MRVRGKRASIKKIEVSRKKVCRGGRRMEVTNVKVTVSPVGESIREIQKIVSKYLKTEEEIDEAERRLREALRKEGYYRF
jgi:dissimilatory sulfite reductase (desulfoviridin) alpha/beta subunit